MWEKSKKALCSIISKPEKACPSIIICSWTSWTAPLPSSKTRAATKWGKKDILKVECDINTLDLDVLAVIDHNITVNVIKNGEIVAKKGACPSEGDQKRHPLQEPPLHHFH